MPIDDAKVLSEFKNGVVADSLPIAPKFDVRKAKDNDRKVYEAMPPSLTDGKGGLRNPISNEYRITPETIDAVASVIDANDLQSLMPDATTVTDAKTRKNIATVRYLGKLMSDAQAPGGVLKGIARAVDPIEAKIDGLTALMTKAGTNTVKDLKATIDFANKVATDSAYGGRIDGKNSLERLDQLDQLAKTNKIGSVAEFARRAEAMEKGGEGLHAGAGRDLLKTVLEGKQTIDKGETLVKSGQSKPNDVDTKEKR